MRGAGMHVTARVSVHASVRASVHVSMSVNVCVSAYVPPSPDVAPIGAQLKECVDMHWKPRAHGQGKEAVCTTSSCIACCVGCASVGALVFRGHAPSSDLRSHGSPRHLCMPRGKKPVHSGAQCEAAKSAAGVRL